MVLYLRRLVFRYYNINLFVLNISLPFILHLINIYDCGCSKYGKTTHELSPESKLPFSMFIKNNSRFHDLQQAMDSVELYKQRIKINMHQ